MKQIEQFRIKTDAKNPFLWFEKLCMKFYAPNTDKISTGPPHAPHYFSVSYEMYNKARGHL